MKFFSALSIIFVFACSCTSHPNTELKAQQIYHETDSLVKKASSLFTDFYEQNKVKVQHQDYKGHLRLLGDSLKSLYDSINLGYSEKIGLRDYSREDQERFTALINPAKEYIYQLQKVFKVNSDIHPDSELTLDNFCFYLRDFQAAVLLSDMYKTNPSQKSRLDELEVEAKVQQQKADEIGAKLIEYKKGLDEEWEKSKKNFVSSFPADVKFQIQQTI